MTLEKPAKNVVQQLTRIDRLKIERRFTTRFEAQHALSKKAVWTVAINAQTTRTVNKLRPKLLVQ